MRDRHDEEVGLRQKLVELFRTVKLVHTLRGMVTPSIYPDHAHSERMAQASGFAANATNAEDQGGSFGKVHDSSIQRSGQIFAPHLLGHVVVKSPPESEDECHDV